MNNNIEIEDNTNEEVEEGQIPSSPNTIENDRKIKKSSKYKSSRESRSKSRNSDTKYSKDDLSRSRSRDSNCKKRSRSSSRSISRSRSRNRSRSRSRNRSRSRDHRHSYGKSYGLKRDFYHRKRMINNHFNNYRGSFQRGAHLRRGTFRRGGLFYPSQREYSYGKSMYKKDDLRPNLSKRSQSSSSESDKDDKGESLNPTDIKKNEKQITQSFLAMLEEKKSKEKMIPIQSINSSNPNASHSFVNTFASVTNADSKNALSFNLEEQGWQVIDDASTNDSKANNKNKVNESIKDDDQKNVALKEKNNEGLTEKKKKSSSKKNKKRSSSKKDLKRKYSDSDTSDSSDGEYSSSTEKSKISKSKKNKQKKSSIDDDRQHKEIDANDNKPSADTTKKNKIEKNVNKIEESLSKKKNSSSKKNYSSSSQSSSDSDSSSSSSYSSSSSSSYDDSSSSENEDSYNSEKNVKAKKKRKKIKKKKSKSSKKKAKDNSDSSSSSDNRKKSKKHKNSKKNKKLSKKRYKKSKKRDKKKISKKKSKETSKVNEIKSQGSKNDLEFVQYTKTFPSLSYNINPIMYNLLKQAAGATLFKTEKDNSFDDNELKRDNTYDRILEKEEKITYDSYVQEMFAEKKDYSKPQDWEKLNDNSVFEKEKNVVVKLENKDSELDVDEKKLKAKELLEIVKRKKESQSIQKLNNDYSNFVNIKKENLELDEDKLKSIKEMLSKMQNKTPDNSHGYDLGQDYMWYIQYYINSFGLDAYSAAYYAQYAMVTSSDYQTQDIGVWMQQQGYNHCLQQEQEKQTKVSELIDDKVDQVTENQSVNKEDDSSLNINQEKNITVNTSDNPNQTIESVVSNNPITSTNIFDDQKLIENQSLKELDSPPPPPPDLPKMSTFTAINSITLPNGVKLPAGTKQIFVYPYHPSHPIARYYTDEEFTKLTDTNSEVIKL